MRQITVLDTTLRDGEQAPGCTMKPAEKLQIAKQLERLRVDVIEAGFPVASPDDLESVRTIAREIRDCGVAAMCRATTGDISCAWEAVRDAVAPRLHLVLATSDLHLNHKLGMTRDQLLEHAASSVRFAKRHCSDIQFSPEDCTRADRAFLLQVLRAVVDAGVTMVNLTDTVGYLTPEEATRLVHDVRNALDGRDIRIGIHCHNDLGMAVANTLCAVKAGADHVECTIGGIGERAGNAALEEVVMALHTRADIYHCETRINTRELYQANRLLSGILNREIPDNKAIVGANAFAHESGIHQHGVLNNPQTYEIMNPEDIGMQRNRMVLGKHSGKAALRSRLEEMGYHLQGKALEAVTAELKKLADRKKSITDRDVEELVTGFAREQAAYTLESFVVNSGTDISSTAVVRLRHNGKLLEQVRTGESPVIAAFNAVDKMIRHSWPLHHFTIQSISEGRTAISEVAVQIQDGDLFTVGRGMATDIVEASIRAYLNAINQTLFRKQTDLS